MEQEKKTIFEIQKESKNKAVKALKLAKQLGSDKLKNNYSYVQIDAKTKVLRKNK